MNQRWSRSLRKSQNYRIKLNGNNLIIVNILAMYVRMLLVAGMSYSVLSECPLLLAVSVESVPIVVITLVGGHKRLNSNCL